MDGASSPCKPVFFSSLLFIQHRTQTQPPGHVLHACRPPPPYSYTHTHRPKAELSGDPRASYSWCVETIARKCPGNPQMQIYVVRIGLTIYSKDLLYTGDWSQIPPRLGSKAKVFLHLLATSQDAKGGTRACGPAPTCLSPEPAVHGTSSLVPWPTVAAEKLTPG